MRKSSFSPVRAAVVLVSSVSLCSVGMSTVTVGMASASPGPSAPVAAESVEVADSPPDLPNPAVDPTAGATQWFTPTSRSIRNTDGSVSSYLYTGPTFHEIGGRWAAIDPTLLAGADSSFSASGALVPTSFGATPERLASLRLPAGTVTLSTYGLSVPVPSLDPTSNTVVYPAVATDTDLAMTLTNSGVQMRLTLASKDAPTSFSFHLADPDGALSGGSQGSDGSFSFDGPQVDGYHLTIPAPGAYPVTGTPADAPQSGSVHMTVEPSGDGWDITERVDQDWLASQSFPLVVDPDLYWTGGYANQPADCYVFATSTNNGRTTSYCNVQQMSIGSNADGALRDLLQFDSSVIPSEATINNAYLGLAFLGEFHGSTNSPASLADTIDVYRNGQAWDTTETDGITTWNRATYSTAWNGSLNCCTAEPAGGGDPVGAPDSSCATYGGCALGGGDNRWVFPRIINTVQAWVGGVNQQPAPNYGVVLTTRNQDAAPGNPLGYYWLVGNHNGAGMGCASSGDPYQLGSSCQPYAYVNYTPLSAPDVPTGFTARASSPGCVALSWNASARAASYFVQAYYDSPFSLYNTWSPINSTSTTLCGLPIHQTFDFYVSAQNDMGGSGGAGPQRVTVTGSPPASPTGVVAKAGDKKVTVTWNPVSGADSYLVSLYDTVSGYTGLAQNPTTAATTFGGLSNGRSYYAYVQALNNIDGQSSSVASNTVTPAYTGLSESEGRGMDGATAMGHHQGHPAVLPAPGGTTKRKCKNRPKCGEPVDDLTGSLVEQITDAYAAGRGPALEFTRTFNGLQAASQTTPGSLGYGWTGSYAAHLDINGTSGVVTVNQDDGSTITYTPSGGTYSAAPWVIATLTHNVDGSYTMLTPDGMSYTFNAAGQLTKEGDRNGYATTLSYSNGLLSAVTDTAGRQMTFAYNGSNQLVSITDPAGRVIRYGYDQGGNLATVTDPAGAVTAYGYDSLHRIVTITDPNGNAVLTNGYDTQNRVVTQTDALGHVTSFGYGSSAAYAEQTTITAADGTVLTEGFDNGVLVARTVTSGTGTLLTSTAQTYNANGDINSITDGLGHTMQMSYDPTGNLLTVTDPLGHATRFTYDSINDLTTSTDPSGVTTTYQFDASGNLLSASTPDSSRGNAPAVTSYSYGDGHPGDVTAVTDPNGHTTTISYNSHGIPASITGPNGATTVYHFSNAIDWVSSVDGSGQSTNTVTRDSDGRLLTLSDALNQTTRYTYDADGNVTSISDPLGNKTVYQYDKAGEPTAMTTGYGTADAVTESSTYDSVGNIVTSTSGNGYLTRYVYDGLGHPTSTTDPDGRVTSYRYDLAGQAVQASASGVGANYGYDASGQLTGITYFGRPTPAVSYQYDSDGRRVSMTDGSGTSTYQYNSLGELTGQANGAGQHVAYAYDPAGQLTFLTYPNGKTVQRRYGAAGNMVASTDWLGKTTSFAYNLHGNLTEIDYPNGVAEQYQYDATDDITRVQDIDPSAPTVGGSSQQQPVVLSGFGYSRNGDGQVAHEQPLVPVGAPVNAFGNNAAGPGTSYGYNALSELTSVATSLPEANVTTAGCTDQTCPLLGGDVPGPKPYTYDHDGNLTEFPNGEQLSYDHADQLTKLTLGTDVLDFAYNGQGDRTSISEAGKSAAVYGYDAANQLTDVGVPGTLSASFTYDGDGLRARDTINADNTATTTNTFAYDLADGPPLTLTDGTGNYIYGPSDLPIEQIGADGQTAAFFGHDQQGSTRILMSDKTPLVTGSYDYTPYGNTIHHAGTDTPLQYDGQYHDQTGLYYLRARYYDPRTAQFLTRDPIETLTGEAYSYAGADPVNLSDPLGLCGGWTWVLCEAKKHVIDPVAHVVESAWDVISGSATDLFQEIRKHATAIEEVLGAATGVICIVVTAGGCGAVLAISTVLQLATEAVAAKSAKGFAEQAATTLALSYVGGKIGLEFEEAQRAKNTAKAAKLLGRMFTGLSSTLGGVLTAKVSSCG